MVEKHKPQIQRLAVAPSLEHSAWLALYRCRANPFLLIRDAASLSLGLRAPGIAHQPHLRCTRHPGNERYCSAAGLASPPGHRDLEQPQEKRRFPGGSLALEPFPAEGAVSQRAASMSPRKREAREGSVGSDEPAALLGMGRAHGIPCPVGADESDLVFSRAMEVTVPARLWPWETSQPPRFPLNAMSPVRISPAYTP